MLPMCEAGGVGCGSVLEGRQKLPAQAESAEAEVGADLISQGSESQGQKREKACLLGVPLGDSGASSLGRAEGLD